MNRRSFMQSILALGMAPAIVRADSLMRIVPRDTGVVLPETYSVTLCPSEIGRIITIRNTDAKTLQVYGANIHRVLPNEIIKLRASETGWQSI